MSDLVVETGTPTFLDCAEGVRVLGPGLVALKGHDEGNEVAIATGALGGVADAADFAVDPIASMGASLASFCMEYMAPLREALDSLAGNPLAVQAQAQTWVKIGAHVVQTADDYSSRVTTSLTGWSGPAATAYRAFVSSYTDILGGVSTLCSGISSVMVGASVVVGFVRAIVRETIADLVGKLISWASQIALTAGFGGPGVIAQAVRSIALYIDKVRTWITELVGRAKKLAQVVQTVNKSLDDVSPVLKRIRESVDAPMFPMASTRALNRGAPNFSDFIPQNITSLTTAVNSGAESGIDARKEPS